MENDVMTLTDALYRQFISKTRRFMRSAPNGCVEWHGPMKAGHPWWDHESVRRKVWQKYHQSDRLNRTMVVFSRCNNPLCICPAHLDITFRRGYAEAQDMSRLLWEMENAERIRSHEPRQESPQ